MPPLRSERDIREWIEEQPRNPETGCWEYSGKRVDGYGQIGWRGKKYRVHRLAYALLVSDPGELRVLHRCDNRCCCNPAHLRLGTQERNIDEMYARERSKALLSAKDVQAIRDRKGQARQVDLAREYGVSQGAISRIQRGDGWQKTGSLDGCHDQRARLTEDDVRAIRLLLAHQTNQEIATRFDVTYPTIAAIREGRTWRYVT
jgi:hypothetical protein